MYATCQHCGDYLDEDGGHCMYSHKHPALKSVIKEEETPIKKSMSIWAYNFLVPRSALDSSNDLVSNVAMLS